MISRTLTIVNKLGLHARAAAKLVGTTSAFSSSVMISKDGREVNGKSIMGVMMLAAGLNSSIEVSIEGSDEIEAMTAVDTLVADRFGEDQ